MKDMPAALLVILSKRDPRRMHRAFARVVDNGRVLRTMFQMIRSGQFGRKSLSASLQRAFHRWLNEASVDRLAERFARYGGGGTNCALPLQAANTQTPDRSDILNVGGFSDAVLRVVAAFLAEDAGRFVAEVEAVEL
jgi:hypothetical protein